MDYERFKAMLNLCKSDIDKSEEGKVQIHDKKYATVGLRLKTLREYFGANIELQTHILKHDEEQVTIKAEIYFRVSEHSTAQLIGDGYANKHVKHVKRFLHPSLLEFCQTSAWGRALASIGLLGDTDVIASAEEMILAGANTESKIQTKDIKENDDAFAN